MAYELFVSLRHLRAKRTQKIISLNTWLSIGGVALGVTALIVVIAVMSGFGKNIRDKILGTNGHAAVTHLGSRGIDNFEDVIKVVEGVEGVVVAAPFVLNHVMLNFGSAVSGVAVRGVDIEREAGVSDLKRNIKEGALEDLSPDEMDEDFRQRDGIILGKELKKRLGVQLGDVISMVAPAGRITPMGLIPRIKLFEVVGVFETGMYEYDSSLAFVALDTAQRFFSMNDKVTGIEIRVDQIDEADIVAERIREKLDFPYYVRDWKRMNKSLFAALQMEKVMMFIILILIILVAAFNIVSTLFMVVMEKTKEISILKSMGASRASIMKIFSYQGLIIGLVGTLLGVAGGFTLVPNLNNIADFLENNFDIKVFPSDIYYLDKLPSEIQYMDSFLIVIFSIVICCLASLYPAWRASRLDPVEGLRYE